MFDVKHLVPSRGFVIEARGFADQGAALAWLAAYATVQGYKLISEVDSDNPSCIDALVCGPTHAEQYTIEPTSYA